MTLRPRLPSLIVRSFPFVAAVETGGAITSFERGRTWYQPAGWWDGHGRNSHDNSSSTNIWRARAACGRECPCLLLGRNIRVPWECSSTKIFLLDVIDGIWGCDPVVFRPVVVVRRTITGIIAGSVCGVRMMGMPVLPSGEDADVQFCDIVRFESEICPVLLWCQNLTC